MRELLKWTVLILLFIVCIQTVSAISVGSIMVDPSGSLTPGTPVTVQFEINASGFPSGGEIRLFTDVDNPKWTYTIIVNGIENLRPVEGDQTLTISGFVLSYKTSDDVSVRTTLEGVAPSVTQTANKTLIRITEFDSNGNAVINTQVEKTTLVIANMNSKIGIFRPSSGIWSIDSNGNNIWEVSDKSLSWGLPEDIPIIGDWNGDGIDGMGIFRPSSGIWSIDSNENFIWEVSDKSLSWGMPNDVPVVGDWNGDGKEGIGIFRPSSGIWSVDSNENFVWEVSDKSLSWGLPNDKPVVGKY